MNSKRQAIYNKSGGVCWYCGCDLPDRWHVDHFEPLKREPSGDVIHPERDDFENLVPACPSCNIMKSSMTIERFRQLISNFVKRLNRDVTVFRHAKRYGLVKETGNDVIFWFEINEKQEEKT